MFSNTNSTELSDSKEKCSAVFCLPVLVDNQYRIDITALVDWA